jgi:hypothetical protein
MDLSNREYIYRVGDTWLKTCTKGFHVSISYTSSSPANSLMGRIYSAFGLLVVLRQS